MKYALIALTLLILTGCWPPSKVTSNNTLFYNSSWRLDYVKYKGNIIRFADTPDAGLVISTRPADAGYRVTINGKRFTAFDGYIHIHSLSDDTASKYYTPIAYTAFYNLKPDSTIEITWFDNISWAFDFSDKRFGNVIGRTFDFKGKYTYSNNRFVFYKPSEGSRADTIMVLVPYKI